MFVLTAALLSANMAARFRRGERMAYLPVKGMMSVVRWWWWWMCCGGRGVGVVVREISGDGGYLCGWMCVCCEEER